MRADPSANVTAVTVSGIPSAFSVSNFGLNITNIGVTPQANQVVTVVTVTVSNGEKWFPWSFIVIPLPRCSLPRACGSGVFGALNETAPPPYPYPWSKQALAPSSVSAPSPDCWATVTSSSTTRRGHAASSDLRCPRRGQKLSPQTPWPPHRTLPEAAEVNPLLH